MQSSLNRKKINFFSRINWHKSGSPLHAKTSPPFQIFFVGGDNEIAATTFSILGAQKAMRFSCNQLKHDFLPFLQDF
jgi:hypothetical protein